MKCHFFAAHVVYYVRIKKYYNSVWGNLWGKRCSLRTCARIFFCRLTLLYVGIEFVTFSQKAEIHTGLNFIYFRQMRIPNNNIVIAVPGANTNNVSLSQFCRVSTIPTILS